MIGTTAEMKSWQRKRLQGADGDLLTRVLTAASDYIEERTSRLWTKSSHTVVLDGDRADGRNREILMLGPLYRPAHYTPGTDDIVVTENGEALTVASGYTTTADVVLSGVNDLRRRLRLYRRGTAPANLLVDSRYRAGWAAGIQNISVTLNAGASAVPADLVQAAYELAALYYEDPAKVAKVSSSRGGASITIERDLSAVSQRAIQLRAVA